jgi:ribonucleotide reductase alpha subunit
MFKKNTLAYDVWSSKYQHNEETVEQFFSRLSSNFYREFKYHESLSEYGKERLNKPYDKTLRTLFEDFKYVIPGGSVLAGIGTDKPVSLSNCFVIGTEDSVSEIFDTAKQMANIYKRRGGVGTDMSELRPRGALVNNAANTTTGVVPFMELFSQTTNTIGQEGRRGALMISLDIRHPDSPEFAVCKRDLTKITGANISLKVSKDFMEAVEKDEDYLLRWPVDKVISQEYPTTFEYNKLTAVKHADDSVTYVKKVRAKELWDTIIESNWKSAEPGILFWDNIIDYDPASVYPEYRAISTNPCLTPDTTVITKKGIIPIIELVDKEVEVWNGYEWSKVKPFKTSDSEQVYLVKFSDGSFLECTSYHEFILKDKSRKKLKDCSIGDKLAKFNYPNITNFEELDEESKIKNYTLGFFAGDGTIAKEEGRPDRYFIDLYGDKKELLPYLAVSKYGNENEDKIRTILNFIPDKPKNYVPIKEYNTQVALNWLAGIIDSDGTLNNSGGCIAITSIDKDFLLDIKTLLLTLGVSSKIGINKESQIKKIKESNYECKTCFRLVISASNVKKLIDLGLILHRIPMIANPSRSAGRYISIDSITATKMSDTYCLTDNKNHSCVFNHVMTGQCGEIPLSSYDACRLIAVNVYNLVTSPFTEKAYLNEKLVYEVFYEAQIIADTLVDIELEHIERIIALEDEQELWKKIYEIGKNGRRTGTGITALGDMCAALGVPYGDSKTIEKLMYLKLKAELDATIDLAIIEGAFPSYQLNREFYISEDGDVIGKNSFFKFLAKEFSGQVDKMIKYGRRNISWSTCPPTGSISILTGTSSGIEPQFSLFYNRRKKCNVREVGDFTDQNGEQFKTYTVIADKFKQWMEINNYDTTSTDIDYLNQVAKCSPWYQQCAADLDVKTRVHTQQLIQKYISHSISSTVNLPSTATQQDVETIFKQAYQCGLKGITVYREGSRSGILIKSDTTQPVKKVRPKILSCKVMHFINEKTPWVAFVGLKDEKPFEIFTGPNDIDVFPVPKYIKEGCIIKQYDNDNKSRYDFMYTDNYGYKNILGGLSRIFNQEYWNYARFVSALLRSDMSIEEVVKIVAGLSFVSNSMNNWQNGVLRCLKSYIKEGTKVQNEVCPECHQATLIYNNGCKQCQSCGYSQCL